MVLSPSSLPRAFRFHHVAWAAVAVAATGCPSSPGPSPPTGSVIVGVTSDLTTLDSIDVQMFEGGSLARQETLPPAFPTELPFSDLPDGQDVRVELEGIVEGLGTVVRRSAATTIVGGQVLLLPVGLEAACQTAPDEVACSPPQTCIQGACQSELTPASALDAYSEDWAGGGSSDVCKPPGGEPPTVTVGEGQGDYLPLGDGDLVQVEAGPQGGYHVWVAVRMKNLLRSGSVTMVSGYVPELDYTVPSFNVIFTFDQDEGGFCKLYGLRYRLDSETAAIEALLGKTLELTVTITDKDGTVGTGQKTVTLSDDFI